MATPGFFDDQVQATKIARERAKADHAVNRDEHYRRAGADLRALLELLEEGEPCEQQLDEEIARLDGELAADEVEMLLSGPHDDADAILEFNPGAGGIDAQDWAEMLVRMYMKWCEKRGYKAVLVDRQPGEEAGIKGATLRIAGPHAYGHLRTESGIHRLIRISPFDQQGRRHTAFASVRAYPDIAEEIEIDIDPKDLRVDTYRSSGAGGQHVNVTDSAIRITHIPTNIVVTCQNERSQHANRDVAMRVLKARLYEMELEKQRQAIEAAAGERRSVEFGHQLRSYFMHPTQRVKDHRTGLEIGDLHRVLDGDLDPFIQAFLTRPRGAEPVAAAED